MGDKPRKISLTVRQAAGDKFDVVLSVDGAVVQSNGPHGKYTALGRLDDYGEALQRFVLWHDVPEMQKPERDIKSERAKLAVEFAAKSKSASRDLREATEAVPVEVVEAQP